MRRSRKLLFCFEFVGVRNFISKENIEEILKKCRTHSYHAKLTIRLDFQPIAHAVPTKAGRQCGQAVVYSDLQAAGLIGG